MNQLNDDGGEGVEHQPRGGRPPQYFTFAFDPLEVTHRFDAILNAHFAQLPAPIPVENPAPATLSWAKAKLAQISANLQLLHDKRAAWQDREAAQTDTDREEHFGEMQHLLRQVDAWLLEIENPPVLQRLRREAHRRRRQRQRAKEHRDRRWREQKERRAAAKAAEADAAAAEVERARAEAEPAKQSQLNAAAVAKRKTAAASEPCVDEVASSYLRLLDRLAELHRVRCQQATRPTDATFLAELDAMRESWGKVKQSGEDER